MRIQVADQADISVTSFNEAVSMLEQGSYSRIQLNWDMSGDEFFRLVNLVKQTGDMDIEKEKDGFWLKQKQGSSS